MNTASNETKFQANRQGSRRELQDFFDDVEQLVSSSTNLDDEAVARVRRKVESSLQEARAMASRTAQRLQDGITDAAKVTDQYVHERPWTTVGIAALVGVAVGVLLGRR